MTADLNGTNHVVPGRSVGASRGEEKLRGTTVGAFVARCGLERLEALKIGVERLELRRGYEPRLVLARLDSLGYECEWLIEAERGDNILFHPR